MKGYTKIHARNHLSHLNLTNILSVIILSFWKLTNYAAEDGCTSRLSLSLSIYLSISLFISPSLPLYLSLSHAGTQRIRKRIKGIKATSLALHLSNQSACTGYVISLARSAFINNSNSWSGKDYGKPCTWIKGTDWWKINFLLMNIYSYNSLENY